MYPPPGLNPLGKNSHDAGTVRSLATTSPAAPVSANARTSANRTGPAGVAAVPSNPVCAPGAVTRTSSGPRSDRSRVTPAVPPSKSNPPASDAPRLTAIVPPDEIPSNPVKASTCRSPVGAKSMYSGRDRWPAPGPSIVQVPWSGPVSRSNPGVPTNVSSPWTCSDSPSGVVIVAVA